MCWTGQQSVELKASASLLKVPPGGQVVLHVERRTTGQWKKIGRNELTPGQCWVYRPPVEVEPEVAADVQWAVEPENALEFHSEYQLDQDARCYRARRRQDLADAASARSNAKKAASWKATPSRSTRPDPSWPARRNIALSRKGPLSTGLVRAAAHRRQRAGTDGQRVGEDLAIDCSFPYPPRGYWMKLNAGKALARAIAAGRARGQC